MYILGALSHPLRLLLLIHLNCKSSAGLFMHDDGERLKALGKWASHSTAGLLCAKFLLNQTVTCRPIVWAHELKIKVLSGPIFCAMIMQREVLKIGAPLRGLGNLLFPALFLFILLSLLQISISIMTSISSSLSSISFWNIRFPLSSLPPLLFSSLSERMRPLLPKRSIAGRPKKTFS